MQKLAEEMNKETIWVKSASANVNREDTNDDIIVTTVEGYMYQIYYDEVTEQKFIEYVGKENKGALPNLVTKYNKEKAEITAEVTNTEEVEIEKVELIYRGEVLETKNSSTVIFSNLQYTGWYMVRVTATSGQMRYAWIRISSTVVAPKIDIISNGVAVNDWYGADQVPLKVRISTDNPTAKGITYMLGGAVTKGETRVDKTTVELEEELKNGGSITVSGRITITAWVDDGENGNVSERATLEVKYDSIKPILAKNVTTEKSGTWYNSETVTISLSDSTDANSGVAKYKYKYTIKDSDYDNDIELGKYKEVTDYRNTPITISKDGIRKIEIVVVDNAGNVSDPQEVEIYKDSTKPEFITDEISITDVTTNSFRINTGATDNLSGNPERDQNYKIMYHYTVKTQTGEKVELGNTPTQNNYYDVTGLTPNVMYIITVEATDMAENKAIQTEKQQKTKGELLQPDIKFEPSEPTNNGWYHEDVKAIITDTATEARTGSKHIVYQVTGKNKENGNARKVEIMLKEEGSIDVTANVVDDEGGSSETNTKNVKIDKTPPNAPTVSVKTEPDGLNKWYKQNVSVTISNIEDLQKSGVNQISGADKVIYKIDSGAEQTITLESTSITEKEIADAITTDGRHTITAWTQDKAGNKSGASTVLNINKDAASPSKAELTVGTIDYHTISVTAKGDDVTSGVASYEFQKSTTIAEEGFKTVETIQASELNDSGTCEYTYDGLDTATTYYFRVVVTDKAGNTATSTIITANTQGELKAPTITLTSTLDTDNMAETSDGIWRKGNISINIKDSGTAGQSSATKIRYKITKETQVIEERTENSLTVNLADKIKEDGTYKIEAWAIGRTETETAGPTTRNVKRDATPPKAPTGLVTTGDKADKTSEYYTTSGVVVTLTAGTDPTPGSGVSKIRYKIGSESTQDADPIGTDKTTQVTIANEGTNEITAYTVDVAGNESDPFTITVKKDTVKPNAPIITVTNQEKDKTNGWYTKTINIKITQGSDATSGPKKIRYTINGKVETVEIPTGVDYIETTIKDDGESFDVFAYTIDGAGLISAQSDKTSVKKDEAPPSSASIELQEGVETTIDTISVTAKGTDSTSGVASYTFQKSTTSESKGFDDVVTVKSSDSTYNYTYANLDMGTEYWLRVIVTDNAGLTTQSQAIAESTKSKEPQIGDYVNYQEHIKVATYNAERSDEDTSLDGGIDSYSGVSDEVVASEGVSHNTAHTTENFDWRIYGITDTDIFVIATRPTDWKLSLYGYNGYNNRN